MKVVLIPGNIMSNDNWIRNFKIIFSNDFDNIIGLDYSNWEELERSEEDFEKEIELINNQIKTIDEDYIIIAKSMGVITTLKGIADGLFNPKKCIFLGFPIIFARLNDLDIDSWIRIYQGTPTLFLRKEKDPTIDESIKQHLNLENEVDVIQLEGEDMYYNDIEEIKEPILNYLSDIIKPLN